MSDQNSIFELHKPNMYMFKKVDDICFSKLKNEKKTIYAIFNHKKNEWQVFVVFLEKLRFRRKTHAICKFT